MIAMADNRELEAKIAALAGRINLHKQQEQNPHHEQTFPSPGYGRGRGGPSWTPHRGTPYGYPRGRAGKFASPAHRNRTLVINNVPSPAQENQVAYKETVSAPEVVDVPGSAPTWVSKRDRHMQLINTSVYDQLSQQRARSMAATLEQKQRERDLREKAKLSKHFQNTSTQHYRSAAANAQSQGDSKVHEIQIDGIRFQVTDGGSKLMRISSDSNPVHATPKQAKIGGVTFFRSKNGNLYRAGLVKAKKRHTVKKLDEPCLRFTTTGNPLPSRIVVDIDVEPAILIVCFQALRRTTDTQSQVHVPRVPIVASCITLIRLPFARTTCLKANALLAMVVIFPINPPHTAFQHACISCAETVRTRSAVMPTSASTLPRQFAAHLRALVIAIKELTALIVMCSNALTMLIKVFAETRLAVSPMSTEQVRFASLRLLKAFLRRMQIYPQI